MKTERVMTYYDAKGRPRLNTDRLLIPFRLMTQPGDWCEVIESKTCVAGNVASLCSAYSIKLGVRLQFRDMNDGTFRITNTFEPVRPKKRRRNRGNAR